MATETSRRLSFVFDGWVHYNDALLEVLDNAPDDFLHQAKHPDQRSPADILRHIAYGRVEWLARIDAPGFRELWETLPTLASPNNTPDTPPSQRIPLERAELRHGLVTTADALSRTLATWTTDHLAAEIKHRYQGTDYALSAQWVLMRIVIHDFHHGGQLSMLCQQSGVDAPKLVWLGGHLTPPPPWPANTP